MPASLKHLSNLKGLGKSVISLLARWPKDGLYYAVEVLECDSARKSCNVHFEDGTDCWLPNKEIHLQLDWDQIKDDENIVCCICDDGASKTPNEILMCDLCEQGYHIQCHDPPVDRDTTNFDDEEEAWYCATCKHLESIVTPKPAEKKKQVKQTPAKKTPAKKTAKERRVEQGILDSSSSSSSLSSSPSNVSPTKKSTRKSKKINKVKKESIVETKDLLERVSPELKRERRKENRSSQVKIKVASRKSKKIAEAF